MHQHHLRRFTPGSPCRRRRGARVGQICRLQPGHRAGITLCRACRVRRIPVIIGKARRDRRDPVAALGKRSARRFAHVRITPFVQKGIAEPVPVAFRHAPQHRLVLREVGRKPRRAQRVERGVRIAVTAQRQSRTGPGVDRSGAVLRRIRAEAAVEEAECRCLFGSQRRGDLLHHPCPRGARRQGAMRRQVVEGQRHRRCRGRRKQPQRHRLAHRTITRLGRVEVIAGVILRG